MISVAYKYCNLQMGEEKICSFRIYVGWGCSVKILAFGGFILGLLNRSVEKKICLLTSSDIQLQSCANASSKTEMQSSWQILQAVVRDLRSMAKESVLCCESLFLTNSK